MIKSLRFSALNIALIYISASLIALALFAIPLGYSWHNTIEQSRAEVLQADAQKLIDIFLTKGDAALSSAIETQVGGQLENVENTILLFTAPTFRKLAGNLAAWPKEFNQSAQKDTGTTDETRGELKNSKCFFFMG